MNKTTSHPSSHLRAFFFSLLVGIIPLAVKAQSNEQLIPRVSPPAPEVSALGQYGVYEVSYFTGLPEITIPLYEIKVGDLTVPISISYHAAGRKVTERPSFIGLGWTLQASGNISRRIMGREDEHGYLSGEMLPQENVNTNTEAGLFYLNEVNRNNIDTQPDIYSYTLPGSGLNGKFVLNAADNFKPVMIPYAPLKVNRSAGPDIAFSIVDTDGIEYKLDEVFEITASNPAVPVYSRTAWMLSKMIAPNRQDTIKFGYTPWTGTFYSDITDYITVVDEVDTSIPNNVYSPSPGTGMIRDESVFGTEQRLSWIDYADGKVVFEALTPREDETDKNKLDRILIYTKDPYSEGLVSFKTVEFHQSYFVSTDGTSTKRLRLDSISIKDSNNSSVQRFRFEYNTAQNLPHYTSRARDYWGYYNNKDNNTLVAQTTISYQESTVTSPVNITIGSNIANGRDPDPLWMQANILKKIYYPTGGRTEFTWQTNQYQEAGQAKYAGGLRIYQIKSFDGINPLPVLKTFKYGENDSGYGRANFLFDNYSFQNTVSRRYLYQDASMVCPEVRGSRRDRTFVSTPSIEIEPFDAAAVVYPVVTEYLGDETTNTGKTVYTFTDAPDEVIPVPAIGTRVVKSNHYRRGLLGNKKIFKRTGASSYQMVHETVNSYSAFPDSLKQYIGFKCSKILITDTNLGSDAFLGTASGSCYGVSDENSYLNGFYHVQTGDNKLVSTTESTFDENDVSKFTSISTTYSYENYEHQLVTSISTTNSKGDNLLKEIRYPHESTGNVYTEMIQKHLFDYPVEETRKLNSAILEKIKYNFFKFSDNVYEPQTIYRQIESGPSELEVTFSGYDIRGNVLGYSGRDNIKTSFLWGYQSLVPVAAVAGGTGEQAAYTSFEEASNAGGWTYTLSTNNSDHKTGERCYTMNGTASTNITRSGLTTSSRYVLSFWAKNGTPAATNVVDSHDAAAPDADGWKYFQKTISGTSVVTISGTALIDELRLCEEGAMMTTYSFKPGVGVTSVTDPNNTIKYYNYDSFGRLQAIRDHRSNLLKAYDYHYKLQN